MGKKERKFAMKRILGNRVMVYMITTAMGCDGSMKFKERKALVEDMIDSYREENYTDSITVNYLGIGQKKNKKSGLFGSGYRNSDFDSYFNGKEDLDISDEEIKNYDLLKKIARK